MFSCFTGLTYLDFNKFSKNDPVIGIDGDIWIKPKWIKTKIRRNIPLLVSAEKRLEKYNDCSIILIAEYLLPMLSNQKINVYLKEIADVCEINKNLTFHLERHTFATSVNLSNGVS